jgi:hypothetical protein
MYLILILALAVLFPATHLLNAWLFEFATINHHISLIYLPAFLRLTNLLVLGPAYGTLTTVLGGLLLIGNFEETLGLAMLNIACSSASPLMALMGFRIYFKRRVQLSNLRDLATLTLIYCICNSVIHHAVWLVAQPDQVFIAQDAAWMFIGDLNGALIGAYLLKAIIEFMEKRGFNFSDSSQSKN